MKKILFSDFDGTISINGEIDDKTIEALRLWKEHGHLLYLATGRGINGYTHVLSLMNDIKFNGAILQTGSLVLKDDIIINHQSIEQSIIKKVVNKYKDIPNIEFAYDTLEDTYCFNGSKFIEMGIPVKILPIDSFLKYTKGAIQMCVVALDDNHALDIMAEIKEEFKDEVSVYCNTCFVDILAHDVSKASGISHIITHDKLDINKCIVVGDGGNDISMFKYIDNSYSFNHALDHVKESANKIVPNISNLIFQELNICNENKN